MQGPLPAHRLAWLLLSCLVLGGLAGCGPVSPAPELDFQLELGDDSFCPGGGPQGKDHVDIQLQVRTRGQESLQVTGIDGRWVLRPVVASPAPGDPPPAPLSEKSVRFLGTFGKDWEGTDFEWNLTPPGQPGRYQVEFLLGEQSLARREFGVWFDQHACPDPHASAAAPEVSPAPSPAPVAPIPAVPSQSPASGTPTSPVALELEREWECDQGGGIHDLLVRVRIRHLGVEKRGLRVPGVKVAGVPELDPMERVGGTLEEGYLLPGGTVVYEAHGWADPGKLPVTLTVPGLPGAQAQLVLETHCPR